MIPLDLNLLKVFDALYEARSVTRAAKRLGLTQSAISHALRRLRDSVGDPLFVRSGRSLQPTARASEMAPMVREGLGRLRAAVAPSGFDAHTARRTFTVAAGAYFCTLTIPPLIALGAAQAPDVAFRIVPVGPDLLSALDDGTVDLALGAFEQVPSRLRLAPLFSDDLVWIAAADSPLAEGPLDRSTLMARPRLRLGIPPLVGLQSALSPDPGLEIRQVAELIDRRTSEEGITRGVVYDALTAITIVGRADMVALVPRRIAEAQGRRLGITILTTDWREQGFALTMLWHQRLDADKGLLWLRAQLASLEGVAMEQDPEGHRDDLKVAPD